MRRSICLHPTALGAARLSWMVALLACDYRHATPVAAGPGSRGEDSASPVTLGSDAGAAADATGRPRPADAQPHDAGTVCGDAGAGDAAGFDADTWLAAHGVATRADPDGHAVSSCTPVRVGAPPRDGLLCQHDLVTFASEPGGETAFTLRILVVDGRRLRFAARLPIAAGPEDHEGSPEPDDPNEGDYVRLVPELSSDGLSLTIRDHPGAGCVDELRSYRKQNEQPDLGGALAPHIRVMEAACRSRGSYVWKAGQFVKVTGPR